MNKQWEVGKTYKLVDGGAFVLATTSNEDIFNALGSMREVQIQSIDGLGRVTGVEGLSLDDTNCDFWFLPEELQYFDEVVSDIQPDTSSVPTTNIIEQWLDKLQYIYTNDDSISNFIVYHKVEITTNHGDILGSKRVVEFINNRYSQLKSAENQSKLKELQAKKDKLMLELASVDGEIEQLQK